MMRRVIFILGILLAVTGFAEGFPERPENYVTDRAGILSAEQLNLLDQKLRTFEQNTSSQIFVYVDSTLGARDLEQTCQQLFHNWGIGQKNKNNGVLVAIFVSDHKFRIHTGYGLEGALPDLRTKKIQDEYMRPCFKRNDYYAGIDAGVDQIIYYAQNEFTSEKDETNWTAIIAYAVNGLLFIGGLTFYPRTKYRSPLVRTLIAIGLVVALLLPFVGIVIFLLLFTLYSRPNRTSASTGDSRDTSGSWDSSPIYSSYDNSSGSSDNYSSSDFDGGGGGDSGGGGSDSSW